MTTASRLQGKTALITGAASGIGRESALLFAAEGAAVVAVDVDERGGPAVVADIEAGGGRATFVRADVSSSQDCARMVEVAEKTFGRLDVLFNNAGLMHSADDDAVKTEEDLLDRTRRISRIAWIATVALTALGTIATFWLRPGMLQRFGDQPLGLVFPLLALGGLAAVGHARWRDRDGQALIASGVFIAGMMASTAFALYPTILPAIDPANSLTIHNAAAPQYGLTVGLVWWSIGMVLAATYFVLIYTLFRGKVRLDEAGY